MEDNKYEPLTEEQYHSLKGQLAGVKNHLPEELMTTFWVYCNKIRGERTNQPCSCKSSSGLWGSCVNHLREWVKKFD